jgi:hypothetical protein|nr:MAG TPA: hypothetical protein [Caudoviricetes sp.]
MNKEKCTCSHEIGNNACDPITYDALETGYEAFKDRIPSILDEASEITSNDRNKQYGEPEDCFRVIADYWNTYLSKKLKTPVNAHDVAMMQALLKIARQQNRHKRDNLVDIAGYARCASRLLGDEKVSCD